jgi:hypothetical protein
MVVEGVGSGTAEAVEGVTISPRDIPFITCGAPSVAGM